MRSKSIIVPVVIAGLIGIILSSGCSRYIAPKQSADSQTPGYTDLNERKIPGETARLSIEDALPADKDFNVREEIRRSYPLNPGATVFVNRISGNVKVETADIDRAEVLLIRLAKKKEDLQYRQFSVEQSAENLTIRVMNDEHSLFSSISSLMPEVHNRVILRVPKNIVLSASRISGDLIVGQIEGRVNFRGISGRVKVDRAFGQSEIYNIDGDTDITFAQLNGRGIDVSGIAGNVTLRFEGEVNADLRMRGVAGEFKNELDKVSAKEETSRSGWMQTQIGTGGPEISIRNISGNVTLSKAGHIENRK